MKDNVLKKEFSKNDVQRVRNLVQGKYGDKTVQSVGYSKKQEFHKEGDVWEEDGRKWTIKDGIKQNITKLDKAKQAHVMPMFCPSCKTMMKKTFDKEYYLIHQKCFDCVIEFETELRRLGKFEEYQTAIQNAEIDGYIANLKSWVEDELTISNNSFVTENGDVERWVGDLDKEKVKQSLDESIEYLESLKK
jgi:hypothetical protein